MAHHFHEPERCQVLLLPADMVDWLPEGDIVHLIVDAVAMMDLGAFNQVHYPYVQNRLISANTGNGHQKATLRCTSRHAPRIVFITSSIFEFSYNAKKGLSMRCFTNNLSSLRHLFFTETTGEAHDMLAIVGAKRSLTCRIISVKAMGEEADSPFYFRISNNGLDAVWCGAVAEIMVYYDDGMSDSLIVEWLAERRPLDALEAYSLVSAFTPPLIALVNAPPHAEVELQAAWTMLMNVELGAASQEYLSPDEVDDRWSRVFAQPGISSKS